MLIVVEERKKIKGWYLKKGGNEIESKNYRNFRIQQNKGRT